jgi:uncharacterized protein (DUF924 family)
MSALDTTAASVLDFWFGDRDERRAEWFRKDETFDASIRDRFGATVAAALAGGLMDWDVTPAGALARVLALDQFTRNIFRGTPRAFAGDALALAAARAMVARGDDRALPALRRIFAYLPFEHAEDLREQDEAVRLIGALGDAQYTGYAQRHREVIQRFGRFPHRNAILGRVSSAQELDYLAQPGAGF